MPLTLAVIMGAYENGRAIVVAMLKEKPMIPSIFHDELRAELGPLSDYNYNSSLFYSRILRFGKCEIGRQKVITAP